MENDDKTQFPAWPRGFVQLLGFKSSGSTTNAFRILNNLPTIDYRSVSKLQP